MARDTTGPVVTLFRSRLSPDADAHGYGALSAHLEDRARALPGLLEFKTFTAEDGERLALVVFDTRESQARWRDDAEHRAAQRRGREAFYAQYSISVCHLERTREFSRASEDAPASHPL